MVHVGSMNGCVMAFNYLIITPVFTNIEMAAVKSVYSSLTMC